jgi:hypothetical protein
MWVVAARQRKLYRTGKSSSAALVFAFLVRHAGHAHREAPGVVNREAEHEWLTRTEDDRFA